MTRPAPVSTARHDPFEREAQADAAFIDGVIFSHYFLEPHAEDSGDADLWDDGFGGDCDEGMYG